MLLGTNKLRPAFFIGLGGSGGRVVDVLARRLAADPAFERFADLVHFVAVDTDQNDLSRLHREVHKTNISIADKPRRIALHRGEAAGLAEDRRVTSWVHPSYRFREHSNAGAGQIRLEARYSLHCQLVEAPPQNLADILRKQLQRTLRAGAPNRGSERIRFHVWASTAGGTGSGASLVVANLVRKLAAELGAEAEVFGNFFLPSLFRDRVAGPLVSKIEANGYAALKEIERCQELRYEGGPEPIELVFDPRGALGKDVAPTDRVERAPFDWVYLVDRPEAMTIEEIYAAAGEAAYLQLFTPILGYQEREGDNFRQLQTRLANGYFALQNGGIGASVIELPRERLVRYCARRATIDALERWVIARGGDGAAAGTDTAAIDLTDPAWRALTELEQGRRLDRAFVDFVRGEARQEEAANRPGIFAELGHFESFGTDLRAAFRALLKAELEAAEDVVQIDSINAAAVTPENTSLNAQRDAMLRDLQRARQALAERAVALEKDIASGQLLARFFKERQASPLLQRMVLIELDRAAREDLRLGGPGEDGLVDWCLVPFDDVDAGRHLALAPADAATWKLDQPELRRQLAAFEAGLADAGRRLFKKEQAFAERRQAVVAWFNQIRDTAQETLVVELWQRVMRALKQQVQQRLEVFRTIAKQGMGLVSHLGAEAERARERGLALGEIAARGESLEAGEFHLGSEVFHDERAGVRAWHELWQLVVAPALHVSVPALFGAIDRHLQAGAGGEDAERVLQRIARELDALHRERVARLLSEEAPLTLASGLVLEAKMALTGHAARSREALDKVPTAAVRDYLAEKVARVAGMSRPLGRFDEPVIAGREHAPYRPRFVGVPAEAIAASPVVGEALAVGAGAFERLEDWATADLLSFYQACLGVPLYAWLEVAGPLARAYAHEAADPLRKEPLHIDFRWESRGESRGAGLPGLDPVTRRAWEEARAAATAAGLGALVQALAAGVVERVHDVRGHERSGRFVWRLRGKEGDLGASARELAVAWAALPEGLRKPLTAAARGQLEVEPERWAKAEEEVAGWRFDAEADGQVLEAAACGELARALAASQRRAA